MARRLLLPIKPRRLWVATLAICCIANSLCSNASAAKLIVRTQDNLPRFTYQISGTAVGLLTADDANFAAFGATVKANIDFTLSNYDIVDHATLRDLLATRWQLELLSGNNADAIRTMEQERALEDKPDAKLTNDLDFEAIAKARVATGQSSGPVFEHAFQDIFAESISKLPWTVVGTNLKELKGQEELASHNLFAGLIATDIEPAVLKSHEIGNVLAAELILYRTLDKVEMPANATALAVIKKHVAEHNVIKPDIWAQRDVTLSVSEKLTPVIVAIWDEGSDLSLFPDQVYTDPRPDPNPPFGPHGISYDIDFEPAQGILQSLTPERQTEYPTLLGDLKRFADLQQSIDSPEADGLKRKISNLPANQVPNYFETLQFFGNYVHGTHVAGIAARGNPAIRLAVGRLEWDWRNIPARPTDMLTDRITAAYQAYVDWFRSHGVRIVNMSWGGDPQGYEHDLALNGMGKDAADRKAIARHLFDKDRNGLLVAMKSAPNILFICSAGNSNNDAAFDESMPASFVLPNLLTVGAVDQAGDEASFTSYGKTVAVDANGYQVESYVPGGSKLQLSGTSMASPNTVNLAGKLLALDPTLSPAEVIELIKAGSTPSADGRRHNIDPARSVAILRSRRHTDRPIS